MFKLSKYLFVFFVLIILFFSDYESDIKFDLTVKFAIIYWLAVGVISLVYKLVRGYLRKKKSRETGLKIVQDQKIDTEMFLDELKKYIPILARKRKSMVIEDDYGYKSYDKWDAEKRSFFKKFNYHPRITDCYKGLPDDIYLMHLDHAVREYIKENDVSITWSPTMSPLEYEMFCADILKENGWEARTTSASGDQGVDVIANKDRCCVAIQCKLYSSTVGNKAVQEVVAGMPYWGANVGVVVTNAQYTRSARELAKIHDIYLLHHDELQDLDSILDM
ncbi:TPA: restriction endonuclease [Providencia alcalifaciens]|nr:restriction endonuclease [Providencia alcalifaciens]